MKNKITKSFLLSIVLFSLLSCQSSPRTKFFDGIATTPAKNLRSYAFDSTSTILSRVKPAPDFVVSFWNKTDNVTNYSAYMPTPEEMRMIDDYIEKLPRRHKEVLQKRLVAIYFINNLQGSGATDYVLDDKKDIYTVMLFNPDTLKTGLSQWLTFRENTCFVRNALDVKIEVNCGTKFTGFIYALTHEATHVVDYVEWYTPYIEKNMQFIKNVKTTATTFTKDTWVDSSTPLPQYDFQMRKDITFYCARPKIEISGAVRIYEQLMATPFVSLYGSMSWAEDFADFVMFYHITQVLGQPYEIRYSKNTDQIRTFRPMESAKVKERFSLMQDFY